ncbi:F0F1 ATP synthase subunit delta [bacterium]|nr:F0F1 ATP synthase subunit delta [candidate division CSSED10-310 bacterium]
MIKPAAEYAQALAQIAGSELQVFLDALEGMEEMLREQPDVHRFLLRKELPVEDKVAILEYWRELSGAPEYIVRLLEDFLSRNYAGILMDFFEDFRRHALKLMKVSRVRAIIATDKLSEANKRLIQRVVKKSRDVQRVDIVDICTDPAIVGGIVIQGKAFEIDASIRNRLAQLKVSRWNTQEPT